MGSKLSKSVLFVGVVAEVASSLRMPPSFPLLYVPSLSLSSSSSSSSPSPSPSSVASTALFALSDDEQWMYNDRDYTQNFPSKTRMNFRSLIEACKKTNVYAPAVTAAMQWLNNEPRLSPTGLTSVIQIFGLASLVDDAIAAMDIAKSKGVRLNAYHYNACMNACKIHKRYDEALKLFSRMKEENVRPDLKSFSIIIQIYGLLGEWQTALGIFNAVPTQDRDAKLFTNILSAMEKSAKSEETLKIWTNMKKTSMNMCTSQALNTVISSLGKAGRWEEAVDMFEREIAYVDKMTLFTLTGILEKANQSSRTNEIKAIFNQYKELDEQNQARKDNLSRNVSISLSDVGSGSGNDNGRREEDVDSNTGGDSNDSNNMNGVGNDNGRKRIVFNDLIREAKRSGDYRAAVKAADAWLLTQKKLSPGGVTACINIYGLANLPIKLYHILELISEKGLVVNVKQINTYMSALNRCGESLKTVYIFSKMEDANNILDDKMNTKIQKLIAKNAESEDEATKRFKLIVDEAIRLSPSSPVRDDFSYGAMLNALEKLGQWKLANLLFEKIPSGVGSRSAPRSNDDYRIPVTKNIASSKGQICRNTVMYNTVLSAVCKAGMWREALDIYDSLLLEANIDPDKTSRSLIISVLMRSRQYTAAAAIKEDEYSPGEYADMEEEVVVPSRTFSSLLTPQMIIELEKLNPDPDEDGDIDTTAMQWSDVAAKFSSDSTTVSGVDSGSSNDSSSASWKIVEDEDDDDDNDDVVIEGLSSDGMFKFNEWAKADEKLAQEMGVMELRNEEWARQVTNPQGVTGRAASLEEKLLYQPNSSIDGILKALNIVGRFESAVDLLEKLENEGVTLKVSHYNSAIKACGEIGNWESAVALLNHMVANDVPRSSTSYSLIMNILWEFCGDDEVKNEIKKRGENEGMVSEFTDFI